MAAAQCGEGSSSVGGAAKKSDEGGGCSGGGGASASSSTTTDVRLRVRIEKRPVGEHSAPMYETQRVERLTLQGEPSLDAVRAALLKCELGQDDRDIFFPNWTKTLYAAWYLEGEEDSARYGDKFTIESDTQLREVLADPRAKDGALCLLLQECRNVRYSRKKERVEGGTSGAQKAQGKPRTVLKGARCVPHGGRNAQQYFFPQQPFAFPVYDPRAAHHAPPLGAHACDADGAVYYDQPVQFAPYPPFAPQLFQRGVPHAHQQQQVSGLQEGAQGAGNGGGSVNGNGGGPVSGVGQQSYQEYSMVPPYVPMVPFVYPQNGYNRN